MRQQAIDTIGPDRELGVVIVVGVDGQPVEERREPGRDSQAGPEGRSLSRGAQVTRDLFPAHPRRLRASPATASPRPSSTDRLAAAVTSRGTLSSETPATNALTSEVRPGTDM